MEFEHRNSPKTRDHEISLLINRLLEIQSEDLTNSERWGFNEEKDVEEHDYFKLQQKLLWVPTEINFKDDYTRFNMLTKEQKEPLLRCLVVFQTLDGAVVDSVCQKMQFTARTLSEKLPYLAQIFMEALHSQSYDLQLRAIVPDEIKRMKYLKRADSEEWILRYSQFSDKHIAKSNQDLIYQLTAQAALEGVGFIALFAIIFYYKTHPIIQDIPGITGSNELISRDEAAHRDYAVHRVKKFLTKYPEEELPSVIDRITEIVKELVDIIEYAIPTLLPNEFSDLKRIDLIDYTRFTADNLLLDMGLPLVYKSRMSLPYMLTIGGANKSNFYERDTTAYTRGDMYDEEDKNDW